MGKVRTEIWKNVGIVRVERDERGKFIRWWKVTGRESSGKMVAVYGYVWEDGRIVSKRYEFTGSGRDLYWAVMLAHEMPPKGRFVTVSAREFVRHPWEYARLGGFSHDWIGKPEVES